MEEAKSSSTAIIILGLLIIGVLVAYVSFKRKGTFRSIESKFDSKNESHSQDSQDKNIELQAAQYGELCWESYCALNYQKTLIDKCRSFIIGSPGIVSYVKLLEDILYRNLDQSQKIVRIEGSIIDAINNLAIAKGFSNWSIPVPQGSIMSKDNYLYNLGINNCTEKQLERMIGVNERQKSQLKALSENDIYVMATKELLPLLQAFVWTNYNKSDLLDASKQFLHFSKDIINKYGIS